MFKTQNFCHIASNNRNNVKVGVFVYRTTDNLATVTTSGYFNGRIIDINLHDLIIHEQVDVADQTKVKQNLLCVTERTLENVGTAVIKSDWQGDIEQAIADLRTYVDNNFVKLDGTSVMTGPLLMRATDDFKCAIAPYWDGIGFFKLNDNNSVTLMASLEYNSGFEPATNNTYNIGANARKWKNLYLSGKAYMATINNGSDLTVPNPGKADTLALKGEVDLAANSGRMITDQGVWYAKMYAATVAPSAEDGTNYADFSQTDGQGNPIIVTYNRVNGAWVQDQTITPPAEYDGYVPITSKIWDIAEQAGQQGGRILWNHQSKDFTPYPQIISYENIEITGDSTVIMPATPTDNNIPNKKYVDDAVAGAHYHPALLSWQWADHELDDMQWLRANTFSWQDGTVYEQAYQHLVDDIDGKTLQSETVAGTTIQFYLADDGHKICPDSEESNVTAIYTATGVAWYYILDTVNQRFKLPRTKYGFTGLRDTVGKYVPETLPNIKGKLEARAGLVDESFNYSEGALYEAETSNNRQWAQSFNSLNKKQAFGFDASRSSSTYQDYAPVQQRATQMYLYFYVGSFTQSAIENTAGLNAELFNDKADTDLSNTPMVDYIVEQQLPTSANNYTWYNLYKSGRVEQGGTVTMTGSAVQPALLVTMADTEYKVNLTCRSNDVGWPLAWSRKTSCTTTSIYIDATGRLLDAARTITIDWEVKGMAAN